MKIVASSGFMELLDSEDEVLVILIPSIDRGFVLRKSDIGEKKDDEQTDDQILPIVRL